MLLPPVTFQSLGQRHIRAANVLRGFGKGLFSKADVSTGTGNRKQRKRSEAEVDQIVGGLVEEVLEQHSPVSKYANMSASLKTVRREADTNGKSGSSEDSNGAQNGKIDAAKMSAYSNQCATPMDSITCDVSPAENGQKLERSEMSALCGEIRPGPAMMR